LESSNPLKNEADFLPSSAFEATNFLKLGYLIILFGLLKLLERYTSLVFDGVSFSSSKQL
jgi:hypothetical protein